MRLQMCRQLAPDREDSVSLIETLTSDGAVPLWTDTLSQFPPSDVLVLRCPTQCAASGIPDLKRLRGGRRASRRKRETHLTGQVIEYCPGRWVRYRQRYRYG